MPMQGNLTIERMCGLGGVSRAGFYRWLRQGEPVAEDMEVRSEIQRIFAEHKQRYGYRRVSLELGRRGLRVNHKRVQRLMREDSLLAIQPKAFVSTTDSDHRLEVHLNLARRMELTGIDQLWVADITYLRLQGEFVFLAVVLDAYSRKVVGWELGRTLTAHLPLEALKRALAQRQPRPGLVHHSDRGVQYASAIYTALLRQHGLTASMSRPANPYDNASCESFMRTLKREEIYAHRYRDMEDPRSHLAEFIDGYYNRVRLHSALGYRSPEEFEQAAPEALGGAKMSFFRHEEIYRNQARSEGESERADSPDHRFDESPAGYSLASCSPAELASASPVRDHSEGAGPRMEAKIIKQQSV
jgi:putative transposase